MQDWEELEELESLGEEEGPEDQPAPRESKGSLSTLPLLQAAICVAAALALVYLRQAGHPAYEKIVERYRQEAAQEIQLPEFELPKINLPRWEGGAPASPRPSPSPEASPVPSPGPVGLPGIEVQRL